MAYARLVPFGPESDDLRGGLMVATLANMFRGKGSIPASATDFVLGSLAREEGREARRRAVPARVRAWAGRVKGAARGKA